MSSNCREPFDLKGTDSVRRAEVRFMRFRPQPSHRVPPAHHATAPGLPRLRHGGAQGLPYFAAMLSPVRE